MKLELTQGYFADVEDSDFPDLSQYSWHAMRNKKSGKIYASRYVSIENGKQTAIALHRHLFGLKKGDPEFVDHRDGNGLNNLRSNLRISTNSQNQQNCGLSRVNKSGHKGVCWHKVKKVWIANIRVKGVRVHLGYFHKIEDAARAYHIAAVWYFGEFARAA